MTAERTNSASPHSSLSSHGCPLIGTVLALGQVFPLRRNVIAHAHRHLHVAAHGVAFRAATAARWSNTETNIPWSLFSMTTREMNPLGAT